MRSNESLHGLYTCLNGFCIKSFLTANKTAAKQNISYLKLARNSERGMSGSKIVEGNPTRGLEARPGLLLSGRRGGTGRVWTRGCGPGPGLLRRCGERRAAAGASRRGSRLFVCLCRAAPFPPPAPPRCPPARVLVAMLPRAFRRPGRGEESPIKTQISRFNGLLN